jgi:anaerobic magnesium-protoporphyrin IX monomethyl ester cyclase
MSEVLIGQAYSLHLDPKMEAAGQPYAPLGSLAAAAVLRERGHEVAFHDAMIARSRAEWTAALERHRPRVAVLYEDSFNYLAKMCLLRMREEARALITAARARGAAVLVAGPDATDRPDLYLDAGARAVVAGEGEVTLAEAVDALRDERTSLADVAGLVLPGAGRSASPGTPHRTAPRPALRDLDALPRPAWDLVDVEAYRRRWTARHGYFSMNAVTSRGCPYPCNWCARPIHGRRYAVCSPVRAAEDLRWLKAAYGPDHIAFSDDIFGLAPGWTAAFAEAVAQRGARVPFKCLSRPDLVDDEIARDLARAGCRTVWIGAESGSQKILDAMEKGTTVDEIRAAARRLRAHGIEVGFFLQFGYPGEGLAEIEATRALVRECRPDDIGISVSYPLPGTPFHEAVRVGLGPRANWIDSDDLAMVYAGPFPTDFYRALHRVVHQEHRLHRHRGWRRWAAAARLPWARWRLQRLGRAASPQEGRA